MNEPTNIVRLRQPDAIDDPLTDLLRAGARKMLAQAIGSEAEAYLAGMRDLKLPDGRERLVRHGHGPERTIQTGIGPVEVSRVKIRDRGAAGEERIRFSSAILPKWARRTRSLDALLPILYLRGLSTGDFQEALAALLGKDAPNLSPSAITRLTGEWQGEYERWQARDLSARRYVYVWADGWSLPPGPDGRSGRMHAGADRRDARGQEGAGRLPGRRARERPALERASGRDQAAGPVHSAPDGGW
jgi:transposase-like protein